MQFFGPLKNTGAAGKIAPAIRKSSRLVTFATICSIVGSVANLVPNAF